MSVDSPPDDSESDPARSVSRLPKTNRAGVDSAGDSPSTVRVTEREGTKARTEAMETTIDGARVGMEWSDLRTAWRAWFLDNDEARVVFQNPEGDLIGGEQTHSFKTEYQKRQCARAHDLERELRDRWGTTLYSGMLTLTCSSTDDEGRWRPPLDQLVDLLASWEAVRRELYRVMEGREWEYLGILEPHPSSGYTHIHLAVFARGPIHEERFESVIEAHVRNSPGAEAEAHEDGIDVQHAGDPAAPGGIESLGAYLTAYMTQSYGESALETPEYLQNWYSLMWAAPVQRFRPSQGAQEMMAYDAGEELSSDWEFVGIAPDGDLDEIRECNADNGGVDYERVRPAPSDRSRRKPPPK